MDALSKSWKISNTFERDRMAQIYPPAFAMNAKRLRLILRTANPDMMMKQTDSSLLAQFVPENWRAALRTKDDPLYQIFYEWEHRTEQE